MEQQHFPNRPAVEHGARLRQVAEHARALPELPRYDIETPRLGRSSTSVAPHESLELDTCGPPTDSQEQERGITSLSSEWSNASTLTSAASMGALAQSQTPLSGEASPLIAPSGSRQYWYRWFTYADGVSRETPCEGWLPDAVFIDRDDPLYQCLEAHATTCFQNLGPNPLPPNDFELSEMASASYRNELCQHYGQGSTKWPVCIYWGKLVKSDDEERLVWCTEEEADFKLDGPEYADAHHRAMSQILERLGERMRKFYAVRGIQESKYLANELSNAQPTPAGVVFTTDTGTRTCHLNTTYTGHEKIRRSNIGLRIAASAAGFGGVAWPHFGNSAGIGGDGGRSSIPAYGGDYGGSSSETYGAGYGGNMGTEYGRGHGEPYYRSFNAPFSGPYGPAETSAGSAENQYGARGNRGHQRRRTAINTAELTYGASQSPLNHLGSSYSVGHATAPSQGNNPRAFDPPYGQPSKYDMRYAEAMQTAPWRYPDPPPSSVVQPSGANGYRMAYNADLQHTGDRFNTSRAPFAPGSGYTNTSTAVPHRSLRSLIDPPSSYDYHQPNAPMPEASAPRAVRGPFQSRSTYSRNAARKGWDKDGGNGLNAKTNSFDADEDWVPPSLREDGGTMQDPIGTKRRQSTSGGAVPLASTAKFAFPPVTRVGTADRAGPMKEKAIFDASDGTATSVFFGTAAVVGRPEPSAFSLPFIPLGTIAGGSTRESSRTPAGALSTASIGPTASGDPNGGGQDGSRPPSAQSAVTVLWSPKGKKNEEETMPMSAPMKKGYTAASQKDPKISDDGSERF